MSTTCGMAKPPGPCSPTPRPSQPRGSACCSWAVTRHLELHLQLCGQRLAAVLGPILQDRLGGRPQDGRRGSAPTESAQQAGRGHGPSPPCARQMAFHRGREMPSNAAQINEAGLEGTHLGIIKATLENPVANTILSGEK